MLALSWLLFGVTLAGVALFMLTLVWGRGVFTPRPSGSTKICGITALPLRWPWITGLALVASATLLFAGIAANVVSNGVLTVADAHLAEWLYAHGQPLLTQCLLMITHVHDPIVISAIAAVIAVCLGRQKQWFAMCTVLLATEGGMLLNLVVKQVFQRGRPSFEQPLVTLTTYSFPSGHVVASTVFYGVMAALLLARTASVKRAACMLLSAWCMVVLIGFSRLYLGAHYMSDVLAAFFEGIAWLALCFTAVMAYRVGHAQLLSSPTREADTL